MRPGTSAWWATVRLGAWHAFAWRLDALSALAGSLVVLALVGGIWRAVGPPGLATHLAVAWAVSRVTLRPVAPNLAGRVVSGQVAADLLRPVDLVDWLQAREIGAALATAALVGAPTAVVGLVWLGAPVVSWWRWPMFVVAVGAGVGAAVPLGVLTGLVAVRARAAGGPVALLDLLVAGLGGGLVPLAALPEPLRWVAAALPFRALADSPAAILTTATPATAAALTLAGVCWALALDRMARGAWQHARHTLLVEGG